MNTLTQILNNKIVAIVRGANPDDVIKIAHALYEGGVKCLEITVNSPKALSVIEQLATAMEEGMLIGAGTVLDAATVRAAISAGARFIISPIANKEIIRATRRYGAVSIPGAYTPTEIVTAYQNGGDIIKVFPARSESTYIKDIRGPLPQIPLMPTGGIHLENIREFQKAGAAAFGIGSALVDTRQKLTGEYIKQLTENARQFVQAVNHF